jgi:hypothetical protein
MDGEILKKTPELYFPMMLLKLKEVAILVTINDKKVSLSSEELKAFWKILRAAM